MPNSIYDEAEKHRGALQQLARLRASLPGADVATDPGLGHDLSPVVLDRHARKLVNDVLAAASMADEDGRYWEFATLGSMLAGGCVTSSSRSWMSAALVLVELADRLDLTP